jgi:phosphate/phosphite/phosphonate ABC transporter binding protein
MNKMSEDRSELRFGIVSAAPDAEEDLAALCAELSKQAHETVRGRLFRNFPELTSHVKQGDVDVAWMQPIPAVDLEIAGLGSIVLGVWRGAGSSYSSAVFTRASSPITCLEHLRGKRMAWVDPASAAGYVYPKLKLASLGFLASTTFAQETFYRTHEDVTRAVFDGRADAGATCIAYYPDTRKIQSAGWSKGDAHRDEDVRILVTAGPIPTDAIVVSRRLEESKRRHLVDALMKVSVAAATRDLVRRLFSGEGFVYVGASQYEPLRALLTASAPSSAKIALGHRA